MTLAWTDPADVDYGEDTGLTAAAYERLVEAVNTAGFNVVDVVAREGTWRNANA